MNGIRASQSARVVTSQRTRGVVCSDAIYHVANQRLPAVLMMAAGKKVEVPGDVRQYGAWG